MSSYFLSRIPYSLGSPLSAATPKVFFASNLSSSSSQPLNAKAPVVNPQTSLSTLSPWMTLAVTKTSYVISKQMTLILYLLTATLYPNSVFPQISIQYFFSYQHTAQPDYSSPAPSLSAWPKPSPSPHRRPE